MLKKICVLLTLFFSLFLSIGNVNASQVRITDMNIQATLNEDGSAHIQEVWNIDVNKGTEIYKVFNRMGPSKITGFKVKDETGLQYQNIGKWNTKDSRREKAGKCGIVNKSDGYELCFGIGDYGEKTYTFEYDISHFVKQYNNDQGVNFAFFSDLSFDIDHVFISIEAPVQLSKDNANIWAYGYRGNVNFVNGKIIMESSGSEFSGSKMQLLMRVNNGTFQNAYEMNQDFQNVLDDANNGSNYDSYEESKPMSFLVVMIIVAIIFVGVVLIIVFIAKLSKKENYVFSDHVPLDKKNINMFRDIPCHKDIFEFYYLAKKANLIGDKDRGGMISAILLRWIKEGYIRFDKREESQMIFFKKEGFSIDLDRDIVCINRLETKLLQYFKQAAGDNHCLETKEFDKWCSQNYEKIDEWFDDIDTFIEGEYRRKRILWQEICHTSFMGIKLKKERDVYDVSIREEMEHVIGLSMFLKEMTLIVEKGVVEVEMWEYYLIFASILGIADKVQDQLGDLCPEFNQQSNLDTVYTMHMVHMFAYNSMRASTAAAQASRSSGYGGGASFGGGGGGFSGGGGGGIR